MEAEREQPAEEGAEQDVPVVGDGGYPERQRPVWAAAGVRAEWLAGAAPTQVRAGAEELEGVLRSNAILHVTDERWGW